MFSTKGPLIVGVLDVEMMFCSAEKFSAEVIRRDRGANT